MNARILHHIQFIHALVVGAVCGGLALYVPVEVLIRPGFGDVLPTVMVLWGTLSGCAIAAGAICGKIGTPVLGAGLACFVMVNVGCGYPDLEYGPGTNLGEIADHRIGFIMLCLMAGLITFVTLLQKGKSTSSTLRWNVPIDLQLHAWPICAACIVFIAWGWPPWWLRSSIASERLLRSELPISIVLMFMLQRILYLTLRQVSVGGLQWWKLMFVWWTWPACVCFCFMQLFVLNHYYSHRWVVGYDKEAVTGAMTFFAVLVILTFGSNVWIAIRADAHFRKIRVAR